MVVCHNRCKNFFPLLCAVLGYPEFLGMVTQPLSWAMLDNPFGEEIPSLNIDSITLQAQLKAVSFHPVVTWEKRLTSTWLQPPFK